MANDPLTVTWIGQGTDADMVLIKLTEISGRLDAIKRMLKPKPKRKTKGRR